MPNTIKILSTALLLGIVTTSCSTVGISDYPNMSIGEDKLVESFRFTQPYVSPPDKLKSCLLKNVENNDINIRHSVGMWAVGTIFALIPDKKDIMEGEEVILSDENGIIHAVGNIELEKTINGHNYLIFGLTASNDQSNMLTQLIFSNPAIILEDTGWGKNPGAVPLRTNQYRSRFEKTYAALDALSNQIGSCLQAN